MCVEHLFHIVSDGDGDRNPGDRPRGAAARACRRGGTTRRSRRARRQRGVAEEHDLAPRRGARTPGARAAHRRRPRPTAARAGAAAVRASRGRRGQPRRARRARAAGARRRLARDGQPRRPEPARRRAPGAARQRALRRRDELGRPPCPPPRGRERKGLHGVWRRTDPARPARALHRPPDRQARGARARSRAGPRARLRHRRGPARARARGARRARSRPGGGRRRGALHLRPDHPAHARAYRGPRAAPAGAVLRARPHARPPRRTRSGMTHDEILQGLFDNTLVGNAPEVKDLVNQGLEDGLGPESMLYDALIPSLEEVGARFERGDYFVPEMLIAARAMQGALDILRPLLAETGARQVGTYVMGTVKGDVHDIGKNLVNIMLEGAGFTVHDLGVNVAPEVFIEAINEHQPDIVGFSAFLTTTMPMFKANINALEKAGIRDNVIVMVGGAPVTQEYAIAVGADGYAADASTAVRLAKDLIEKKRTAVPA